MKIKDLTENNFEYEKLKLHIKYISGISLGLIALVIIASSYSNNDFVGQVGFAATISSIILSVIAILMTIIGETKSDNAKDKLVNVSEELEVITKSIGDATNKLESTLNSNQELYNGIYNMQNKIENIDQKISSKDIQTDNAEITDGDKGTVHNCYINIYKDASILLNEEIYKDLSLTLFYIGVKKKCGFNQVSYQEFAEDMINLQIQLNNQSNSWYASLLFLKALWGYDEFNNYLFKTIEMKYYNDVNKILSLNKVKDNEKINN